jgi:hypothetical protein
VRALGCGGCPFLHPQSVLPIRYPFDKAIPMEESSTRGSLQEIDSWLNWKIIREIGLKLNSLEKSRKK